MPISGLTPAAQMQACERSEGTLSDPTNVARYVRDRDQQRWRRSIGSKPLAPTIQVGSLPGAPFDARFDLPLGIRRDLMASPIGDDLEPPDLNVLIGLVESAGAS